MLCPINFGRFGPGPDQGIDAATRWQLVHIWDSIGNEPALFVAIAAMVLHATLTSQIHFTGKHVGNFDNPCWTSPG